MSTLNFNKNSFSVDNFSWDSVDAAKLPEKSEENWRYLKWGKLKKINFHGDFKNHLSNLDDLDLPHLDGYVIVIENGIFNDKASNIPSMPMVMNQVTIWLIYIIHLVTQKSLNSW